MSALEKRILKLPRETQQIIPSRAQGFLQRSGKAPGFFRFLRLRFRAGRRVFAVSSRSVERIKRTDHGLLRQNACEDADRSRPVCRRNAHRLKGRNDRLTDSGENAVLAVLVTESSVRAPGVQERQNHDHSSNHLAGAADKGADTFCRVVPDTAKRRDVIRRNLHDEGGVIAREGILLQKETRQNGDADTDQIKAEDEERAASSEERRAKQHIDRKTGAAGHEGHHHDGHDAVRLTVHRTGGHDGGDAAAKAHDKRNERTARQTDGAHKAVHHESGAGHVTRVLKEGEEEEQAEDHRNEGGNRLNTAADTVRENRLQPARCTNAGKKLTETVNQHTAHENIEEVDKCAADVNRENEHQVHHEKEDRDAEPAVQNNLVDLIGDGRAHVTLVVQHLFADRADELIAGIGNSDIQVFAIVLNRTLQFRQIVRDIRGQFRSEFRVFEHLRGRPAGVLRAGRLKPLRDRVDRGSDVRRILHGVSRNRLAVHHAVHGVLKLLQTLFLARHHADHRAAEAFRKTIEIDLELMLSRDIHHVHDHDHRHPHFKQLGREIEVAFEVAGVNDIDHRLSLSGQEIVASDAFILARRVGGRNGIDTRQIDERNIVAIVAVMADLLLNRNARPVADFLLGTGNGVEKSRLAAVRVADDADNMFGHEWFSRIRAFQLRRFPLHPCGQKPSNRGRGSQSDPPSEQRAPLRRWRQASHPASEDDAGNRAVPRGTSRSCRGPQPSIHSES